MLKGWWLKFCDSGIQVEGYKMTDGAAIVWHSSKIVDRIDPTTVVTKSGSRYILQAPFVVRCRELLWSLTQHAVGSHICGYIV